MFKRFTGDTRAVVTSAVHQAGRLGHGWVGCEHLLLAVAGSPTPSGQILRNGGATPEAVATAIAAVLGSGPAAGSPSSDDAVALARLGIDLHEVRAAVEATFGQGALEAPVRTGRRRRRRRGAGGRRRGRSCTTPSPWRPFTPRAKRCLETSLREALSRRHRFIGVEHLALALLGRDDTVASAVLRHLDIRPEALRHRIDEHLRRRA